ncbi:MAG TPA: PKD domain-containing protein [Solirubrobacteraceae bacterium]|nr:PKD domain-containing protein [Solirubrobacteraceae bacterium]
MFVVILCTLALLVALAAVATPAGAIVAKISGHGYGITPINSAVNADLAGRYETQHAEGLQGSPLAHRYDVGPSGGTQLFNAEDGPVMHSATTHVIYWDPNEEFKTTTKGIVDGFFGSVAHDSGLPTNVFAIAGQYTDSTGHAAYSSTSAAPKTDTEKYPTGECTAPNGFFADPGPPYTECLLDEQLQAELSRFITAEKLPVGPTQLYFLLLPHKVATCFEEEVEFEPGVFEQACSNNVFCAYHSYIEPGTANETIYADIPFSLLDGGDAKGCQDDGHAQIQQPNPDNAAGKNTETRFADVALKYISHEYIEAVTDPLVNEETAWVDAHGEEIGDKCNGVHGPSNGIGKDPNSFLPVLGGTAAEGTLFNQEIDEGHYYLQSEWDNAGKACLMKPLNLGAGSFAVPSATAGSPVGFTGSATDPYGSLDPSWTFGDSGSAEGVSPTHTFALEGEYTVTMTPKDSLTGSTGTPVSHIVKVAAPIVEFPLSVAKVGTGSGNVISAPAGIECGGTCSATFPEGTEVTLTAAPEAGSSFSGWAGPCAGAGKCKVTLDKAREVKAEFAASPKFALEVSKVGTGKGTVSSSPAGISCGAACSAEFAEGQKVALTATAESGSTFVRWSGGACEGATADTCEVVIPVKALSVKAEFAASSSGGGAGGDGGTGGPGILTGNSTSALATTVTAPAPNSTFTVSSAANPKTGAIAVTLALANPGMLGWAATFPNGKFGAFVSASKCKAGQLRLAGKCRPAKIAYAKGSQAVGAAGNVTITLKPSASALKALKSALKQGKGVPVSVVLKFQSSFGGAPVSHTQTVIVKPKKK